MLGAILPCPASEALPYCRLGEAHRRRGVGWRGSPLRTISGADSGFRRTLCLHPRRAKRRAQVCGEITVIGVEQGNKKVRRPGWHLIHRKRSPFPSIGEGLNAREAGRVFECRVRYYHARRAKRCREIRRGEAHRRRGGGLEGFTPPHH